MEKAAITPIRLTYTATAEDLTHAYQRYNRTLLRSGRTLLALVVTLALVAIALRFAMPKEPLAAACIFAVAAAGGLIGPLVMIRWRVPVLARRIYAQQRDLHEALTVQADPEVLATQSEVGESRTPWSHYIRWVEDDEIILLYRSDALFQFIPKRVLDAAQVEALRTFAAAAGVQAAFRRSG